MDGVGASVFALRYRMVAMAWPCPADNDHRVAQRQARSRLCCQNDSLVAQHDSVAAPRRSTPCKARTCPAGGLRFLRLLVGGVEDLLQAAFLAASVS